MYEKSSRKWKKCAGILTEQTAQEGWLLGAGIYLNNRLPISLRTTSVSLKSVLGSETSKELFLDELLTNFWKEYAALEDKNNITVMGNSSSMTSGFQYGKKYKNQNN